MRLLLPAVLLALTLAACNSRQVTPYAVTPDPAVARALVGEPGASAIGICHGIDADDAGVLAEAQYNCRGGTVTLVGSDSLLTPCSLTQPVRSTFRCQY